MAGTKPVNADNGWTELLRILSRVTPRRLKQVHTVTQGMRALARR